MANTKNRQLRIYHVYETDENKCALNCKIEVLIYCDSKVLKFNIHIICLVWVTSCVYIKRSFSWVFYRLHLSPAHNPGNHAVFLKVFNQTWHNASSGDVQMKGLMSSSKGR